MQNGPSLGHPRPVCCPPRSSRKLTSFWQEARVSCLVLSSAWESADSAEFDIANSRWAPSRGGLELADVADLEEELADAADLEEEWADAADLEEESADAADLEEESADAADLEEESVPLASSLERRCNPSSIQ